VGLAAAAIAKAHEVEVGATSRNAARESLIRSAGADRFYLDRGSIAETVHHEWDGGVDKVLELVGTTTLSDSLRCTREHGLVCMAGMVGDRWSFSDFAPMDVIPTAVSLTTYSGGVSDFMAMPMQQLVDQVAKGTLPIPAGRIFHIDDIVEAHRTMESNAAGGKIVVLTR
jgi:NADPH:quinone reductase-like Zn-dependent oxidoreductase